MTEDRNSKPEDGSVEFTQAEHREKKIMKNKWIETQGPMGH